MNAVRWALDLGLPPYRHRPGSTATRRASDGRCATAACRATEVFITTKFYPGRKDPGRPRPSRASGGSASTRSTCTSSTGPQGGPTWAGRGWSGRASSGYARSIGVSNFSVSELEEVHAQRQRSRPAVNQVQFSPFEYRRALLDACQQRDVALEAYSPLGTGRHLADRPSTAGAAIGRTPAQVLLRWCLQHDCRSSPSRRTASGSPRTPRSSTSCCPTRTWPSSTGSTRPAAPAGPRKATSRNFGQQSSRTSEKRLSPTSYHRRPFGALICGLPERSIEQPAMRGDMVRSHDRPWPAEAGPAVAARNPARP